MRRFALVVVLSVAGSAIVANAGDAPRSTAASTALRLPDIDRCIVGPSIRATLSPPAGVRFNSLSIRAGGREVLQLADLAGTGSVVVPVARRDTRVEIGATTSAGQFLSARRTYRRCARERRTDKSPPPFGPPQRIVADD